MVVTMGGGGGRTPVLNHNFLEGARKNPAWLAAQFLAPKAYRGVGVGGYRQSDGLCRY